MAEIIAALGGCAYSARVALDTVPNIKAASAYLVQQGYTNCGTTWLRGQNGYARMERMLSGAIRIIEGVA